MRITCALVLVLSAVTSNAQLGLGSVNDFLVTHDTAYFLDPPNQIGTDLVSQVEPSPDGRYALVWSVDLRGRKPASFAKAIPSVADRPIAKLSIYDSVKSTLKQVDATQFDIGDALQTQWSSDSKHAIFVSDKVLDKEAEPRRTSIRLISVSLEDGKSSVLYTDPTKSELSQGRCFCSPTQPLILLLRTVVDPKPSADGNRWSTVAFHVFDQSGKLLRQSEERYPGYVTGSGFWTADGKNLLLTVFKRDQSAGKPVQASAVYDTGQGKFAETLEKFQMYDPKPTNPPFVAEVSTAEVVVDKLKVPLKPLWLRSTTKSDVPRVLVSPDCDGTWNLLNGGQQVLFKIKGHLFVRDIESVDIELFKQARDAAQRTRALSQAKQVALAAMLYASDNNDSLPGSANLQSTLGQYLKDDKLLDGFVYTFQGGAVTNVSDVANTELGHIDVNGGRCIAYLDGHVKFKKNDP